MRRIKMLEYALRVERCVGCPRSLSHALTCRYTAQSNWPSPPHKLYHLRSSQLYKHSWGRRRMTPTVIKKEVVEAHRGVKARLEADVLMYMTDGVMTSRLPPSP